jgi:hypothetical protein
VSITVRQRRAFRRKRERVINVGSSDAFKFCRRMTLAMATTGADRFSPMTVFRVDYRRGLLHVTVPVRMEDV